jgi:diguanylate cyclase (GGDEF)-like protein
MNPVSDDRHRHSRNAWSRFPRQFFTWVIAGPQPQPYDIQKKMLHNSMRKKNALVVVHLSMAVMASIAIVLTGQPWAYAWLLAEVALAGIRLSVLMAFEKAEASGRKGNAIHPIIVGLVWASVLSAAAYQCVASGEWPLILLAGIAVASVIGGVSSRNAGTPRYGIIVMCILTAPYALATLTSPIPHLFIIGLQMPFYVIAVVVVLLENYKSLLGLYHAERENRWLAHHDLLTGLPNRVMELERFDELLCQPQSSLGSELPSLTVFCLDLDGFKEINDKFGHAVGDAVLVAVADRLRDCVREVDLLCRTGGDEFVILLPDVSPAEAAAVARRIIERISAPFDLRQASFDDLGHASVHLGISIGSATTPHDGSTTDELLRSADRAMYRAKWRGKGIFVTHGAPMPEIVELVPAADANARMGGRFPEKPTVGTGQFPLPSRAKSL